MRKKPLNLVRAKTAKRIKEDPGETNAEISRYLGGTTSSITKALLKLEKRQLNKSLQTPTLHFTSIKNDAYTNELVPMESLL